MRGMFRISPGTFTKKLLECFIVAFVTVALVDPADQIFHLKMPLFIAAMFVWTCRWTMGYSKSTITSFGAGLIATALVIPLSATLIGMLNGASAEQSTSFALCKAALMLFLLPIVISESFDLLRKICALSILVAIAIIAMVLFCYLSPAIFAAIYQFTLDRQNAIINENRDIIGFGLGGFYYKTSVVLIFPLAYHIEKLLRGIRIRYMLAALIYSFALIASGSRANLIMLLLAWTLLCLRRMLQSRNLILISIALLAVITASVLIVPKFFSPSETSNRIKLAHYQSYLTLFERHPSYLIWGQGADTEFYSEGFQKRTPVTELTYFEMVRDFGLLTATFLFGYLAFPIIPLLRRNWATGAVFIAVAYACYILAAGSNPLLLSSTGMLVTVAVWQRVLSCPSSQPTNTSAWNT